MQAVCDFGGLWKRTMLYEPIGVVGPEDEQLKDVLWMQATDGYFIDIRYERGDTDYMNMKSFAGVGSFDKKSGNFTWKRVFDFRVPGNPDIGKMRLLKGTPSSPEQIEEDGVLPGDNYREIWDRIVPPGDHSSDCTARLVKTDPDGTVREGLFLLVGGLFAFTISRSQRSDGKAILETAFSGNQTEVNAYVWEHIACMGEAVTWKVTHALLPAMRGQRVCPLINPFAMHTAPELGGVDLSEVVEPLRMLFKCKGQDENHCWKWKVLTGTLPEQYVGCVRML